MRTHWLSIKSSAITSHHLQHNRKRGVWKDRRPTSAAWIIRRSAVHPYDCLGTCWSTRYVAVGGVFMADVVGAARVGVTNGGSVY